MDAHLSPEVINGINRARKLALRKKNRLRLQVADEVYPILSLSDSGFEIEQDVAPHLRGFVDIYDGAKHLVSCLIIQSELDGDILRYEYKRHTDVSLGPAKDFVVAEDAPIALLR